MTAGTADGERHRAATDDINAIINDVTSDSLKTATERQKSHRGKIVISPVRNLISGQLQQQKTIVGHVSIQCIDNPVAIRPCMNPESFLPRVHVALGVRIPCNIQPVACPVLAMRR